MLPLQWKEVSMQSYEIRLLNLAGTISVYIETAQYSDHAAIRLAHGYAGAGAFEVWRGLDCIHGVAARGERERRAP
jgi:hypothetical protein